MRKDKRKRHAKRKDIGERLIKKGNRNGQKRNKKGNESQIYR